MSRRCACVHRWMQFLRDVAHFGCGCLIRRTKRCTEPPIASRLGLGVFSFIRQRLAVGELDRSHLRNGRSPQNPALHAMSAARAVRAIRLSVRRHSCVSLVVLHLTPCNSRSRSRHQVFRIHRFSLVSPFLPIRLPHGYLRGCRASPSDGT